MILPHCIVLGFVATIQAEETESRDTSQDNHANADQQSGRYSFSNLVAEFPIHVTYPHPLQLRLPQLCKHGRLCRGCQRCDAQVRYCLRNIVTKTLFENDPWDV